MFLNSDSIDQRCISLGIQHFQCFWNLKWCSRWNLGHLKWQNNRMWKGIMKCRRWTNDVGIYVESVVIFWKSRKCFGGRRVYHFLWEKCKIQEWKYGWLINMQDAEEYISKLRRRHEWRNKQRNDEPEGAQQPFLFIIPVLVSFYLVVTLST